MSDRRGALNPKRLPCTSSGEARVKWPWRVVSVSFRKPRFAGSQRDMTIPLAVKVRVGTLASGIIVSRAAAHRPRPHSSLHFG